MEIYHCMLHGVVWPVAAVCSRNVNLLDQCLSMSLFQNLGTKPLYEMLSLQFSWLPTVMSQRLREDERGVEFSTEIFINQRIMLIIRAFTLINIVDSFCGAVQKNRNNLNLPRTIQRTRVLPQMLMSMVTLKRMVQTPSINPPPASRDLVIIVLFSSGLIRSQLLKQ